MENAATSQHRNMKITQIKKRNGVIVAFDESKITQAIFNAAQSVGGTNLEIAKQLTDNVIELLNLKSFENNTPSIEEVQDTVETVLIKMGHAKTAKAYILYRNEKKQLREEQGKVFQESQPIESKERVIAEEDDPYELMFAHKTKILKLISSEVLGKYKELLFMLRTMQKQGILPVHENYLSDNLLAKDIYLRKYYVKDLDGKSIETKPEDVFARIAAFLATVEDSEENRKEYAIKFYNHLYHGHYLPGGRVITGAGDLYRLKTLANCFVSMIDGDNIESIYKTAYECARTYSYGGGIGVDISSLRPRNSIVHNASDFSTGSVSFMELFSLTTGLIGQSGRRGALMLTLDVKHPDVLDFINIKQIPNWVTRQIVDQCNWSGQFNKSQLQEVEKQVRENTQVRFANISLKMSDEFMQAVDEQFHNNVNTICVYKRLHNDTPLKTKQSEIHYSIGIPSKDISNYQLLFASADMTEVNGFLQNYGVSLNEEELKNQTKRNIFGDYILNINQTEALALHYAGDFMLYFNSDQTGEIKRLIKAKESWNQFVASNYKTAEPGLMFWSTMTKYSPTNYIGRPIISTNPCGEIPLQDGGACNLGSLNLSRFVNNGYTEKAAIDWDLLKITIHDFIRMLDNTITWNEQLNPLEKQRVAANETRRLGLGVMGIADMFNQLGIGYDSDEGIALIKMIMEFIANEAYRASALLAKEKSPASLWNYEQYSQNPFYKEIISDDVKQLVKINGLRNIALLSIAPTGTISNAVLGFVDPQNKHYVGVSSGVEPIFALYYRRRSETLNKEESSKFYTVYHPTVQAYVDMMKLQDHVQNLEDLDEMRTILPAFFFRTSHFIDPMKRVQIQGVCQKYIDHSISSTVNLPESIAPETVSQIYFEAWKKGLKGITIYRDGSRYPILSVATQQSEFQKIKAKTYKIILENAEITVKGDEVFTADDGRITTAFHAMENNGNNASLQILELDSVTMNPITVTMHTTEVSEKEGVCKIELKDGKVIKTCEE
ncbi:adenosylcobalamin-dependent ribonucleoside-diphosphate reductase [Candidatus Woesearchaeota archaeon]|nr:adenosylcobalamin-dependent ribonucleoside-diphosphate reductase [Candidatus Woesearchaeota archaeon]